MSVRVMSWVWEHSASKGVDRLVLLAIADSADDSGANAWPSLALLTRKTGIDLRTVQRAVRRLVDLDELAIKMNAGKHGVNVYRVKMTRQPATPAMRHPGDMPDGQDATPAENPVTPGAAPETPRQPATRTVLEPSKTRPSSSATAAAFEEFWKIYPRRTGKRGAEGEFTRALRRSLAPTILAGAARYRDDPSREDEFTKHPSTWLHNDCWADDPIPPRKATGRPSDRDAETRARILARQANPLSSALL